MELRLLPTESAGQHVQGDVRDVLREPDGTFSLPSAVYTLGGQWARWFKGKEVEQAAALAFVADLLAADVPAIALENPISVISSRIRKPDQIIQPWQFGHGEVKATCLWLKNLPPLRPTNIVEGRTARVHRAPPSPDRWKERSRTLPGIAAAMAEQWSAVGHD